MTDKRLVLTTAANLSEARSLAQALVQRRVAACVNIVPGIESIYRWEGKVETTGEYLLLIKTTEVCFEQVRGTIQELHSYDLPECISLPVTEGSLAYLQWIGESVRSAGDAG
jgi:periplasmic divalent cation tolerance protein